MYNKYELEEKIGEGLTVNLVAKSIMLTGKAKKEVVTVIADEKSVIESNAQSKAPKHVVKPVEKVDAFEEFVKAKEEFEAKFNF